MMTLYGVPTMTKVFNWVREMLFEFLWLFSQARLGPGPRQQGRQVQEVWGSPPLKRSDQRSGGGVAQRRSAQVAARKIGVPLVARQGRGP
jgi:hypothetical protein